MIMRMTINLLLSNGGSDHGMSISSALSVTRMKREEWIWEGAGDFAMALKFTPSAHICKFVLGGLLKIIQENVTHE